MSARFIVTGTDTGIGKTVFAAALAGALGGAYWKPIQAGLADETDSDAVRRLSNAEILPEIYRLKNPLSPHQAAAMDGIAIDPLRLAPPATPRTLIIEGAGGLMVPLAKDLLVIDMIARWQAPAILVARTKLGTINHSLLSIEALRARNISIRGIAFIGDEMAETERVITEIGRVHRLGRLPFLSPLTQATLSEAFAKNFDIKDFQ